jgi:phosphohistidine phosphatase
MQLYLVRHAIAFERDPQAWPDDRDRPLTPAGRERFRRAARGLRALGVRPDAVLSSSYVRAWQTAEILSDAARWPAPRACAALEADHRPGDVLDLLDAHAEAAAVALVGHEPHIHQLESLLVVGEPDRMANEFRKGGVACLGLDGPAAAGAAVLLWHATPRLLRAAAG